MEEIANIIGNYGVSFAIVCLFLYDWFTNKKTINETLQKIETANNNIAKTLDLLQKALDDQDKKIDRLLEK